ncbi:MAG: DUF3558 family protein [Nocardia sp.]|nr:DUF3558 family protein [Nocardia sp.]
MAIAVLLSFCVASCAGNTQQPASSLPTLPSQVPSSFDPCRAIPADILSSHHLDPRPVPTISQMDSPTKYRGCWYYTFRDKLDDYGPDVRIEITNVTPEYFRKQNAPTHSITMGAHSVVVSSTYDPLCLALIDVQGGGLQLSNQVRGKDGCAQLTDLAAAIVPLLPPA